MKLKKYFILIISILLFNFFTSISLAVEPNEVLEDSYQEARARNISKKIRCMVCQNQSIDESSSPLAKDLRLLIRNEIKEGKKDEEIYKFLTDRYGDFILLNPPIKLGTIALWFLPIVFLFFGFFIIFNHNKKSNKI
jgi:cytochrome c-type biogenesis protein CcmH